MMLTFINSLVEVFRDGFSRDISFSWFLTLVMGMIIRNEHLGVTSVVRSALSNLGRYESGLHFFRSNAVKDEQVWKIWIRKLRSSKHVFELNGRPVLIGDATKVPKEARRMPGVKKMHVESENSASGQFRFGHMVGAVALLLRDGLYARFACPVSMKIHDGIAVAKSWLEEESGKGSSADSGKQGGKNSLASNETHPVQMVRDAYRVACELEQKCYLVLDRYFHLKSVYVILDMLNNTHGYRLDIITRAKTNCVAFEDPPARQPGQKGRTRKKGKSVHLNALFTNPSVIFTHATAIVYGVATEVDYVCMDLLWGLGFYKKLRFVAVKTKGHGNAIFVCTDLTMDPVKIIEAYSLRFKVETSFRTLKSLLGAFDYRFWTKAMPWLNRFLKKGSPDRLEAVEDPKARAKILVTIRAIERFMMVGCIALGVLQLIALNPDLAKVAEDARSLRTQKEGRASEATVKDYLAKQFPWLALDAPDLDLIRRIRTVRTRKYRVPRAA